MTAQQPVLDDETTILEENDFTPPCEGTMHPMGEAGHVPEEPASWHCRCPRCNITILLCNGRAMRLNSYPRLLCRRCDKSYDTVEWAIRRL